MEMSDLHAAIGRAALDPDGWDDVLKGFEEAFQAHSVGLHIHDTSQNRCTFSRISALSPDSLAEHDQYYSQRNPWFEHKGLMRPGRILTDETIDQLRGYRGAFADTEFYQGLLKPYDLRHHMGSALIDDSGILINFTCGRSAQAGTYSTTEIEAFGAFAAHLKLAVEISQRLEQARLNMHATQYVVDRLGMGLLLIDRQKRVLYANPSAERLLDRGDLLVQRRGTLRCLSTDLTTAFEPGLDDLIRDRKNGLDPLPLTVMLPSDERGRTVSFTALALPRQTQVFAWHAPAAAILVTGVEDQPASPPTTWRSQHRFSEVETKIALKIVEGLGPREIAEALDLTYDTVRWYIKQMFAKTGTRRHSQLQRQLTFELMNTPIR